MHKPHVVIIGGGISGLSTAFFLTKEASQKGLSLKITLLEGSNRFGGVLKTVHYGDFRMEAGADAFHGGQKDALDLCGLLGLHEEVIEAAPCFRNFYYLNHKKLTPVPGFPASFQDATRFLNDPRLTFSAKGRMLLELFVPARKEAGDESLAGFIRRRLGPGFYEQVLRPWVRSVYMADPEQLSLEAMFPRLRRAEREHGSISGSFLHQDSVPKDASLEFFTLKQGLESLIRTLVKRLNGSELRLSTPVRQCIYQNGWEIFLEAGSVLKADALCLAMNACEASKLLTAEIMGLPEALSTIPYDSIASVNFVFGAEDIRSQRMGPGFLIGDGNASPFSSLKYLGHDTVGECAVFRAFLSERMMPGLFQEGDDPMIQKVRAFLADRLDIYAEPRCCGVERYPRALPQYEVGHLERVSEIEKLRVGHSGLFLTGNGFRGFGITDCVRQARITASGIIDRLLRNQS